MRTTSASRAASLVTLMVVLVSVTALFAGDVVGDTTAPGDVIVPGGRWPGDAVDGRHDPVPDVADLDARADLLAAGRAVDAGGLDPGLEAALAEARRLAATVGVELPVASGHRSAEEQLDTLEAEIERRGSTEEALRWVFTPDRSMHVRGLAIDINGGPGADWLDAHGARYGLCRTLEWEWWHFEWRQRWQDEGRCPPPVTDPADAPGA